MEFFCDRSALMEAIGTTQKAVSTHSSLPAIEGLLVQTVGDRNLKITGYDLEIGIECMIEADVKQQGGIILNSRMLGDIIRKMSAPQVHIQSNDKYITNIQGGRSEMDIIGIESAEFPELPKIQEENSLELSQPLLKSMIRQTKFAISANDTKPVHTGSLFDLNEGELKVVSVDGYRLAIRKEKVACEQNMSFVVPGKTLSEILNILSDDEESKVHMVLTRKHIMFEMENVTVVSRLLEGEFLNYQTAIPKQIKINSIVDVAELTGCVERASLLVTEKMKSPVRIKLSDTLLKVNCVSTLGKINDEMDVKGTGGEIEIGFNDRYLLDAMKACETEQAKLELSTPLLPCVIKPVEGESFLFLVLPVRLKGNEG